MCHICLRAHGEQAALFCGDTLFNAGAGNCHNGGHPNELYNTFVGQLAKLPETTLIYPGHDYIARNLGFTLDREPDNARAKAMLPAAEKQDPAKPLVTTLKLEKEINAFFRLTSSSVIARLREAFPDLPDKPGSENGVREAPGAQEQVVTTPSASGRWADADGRPLQNLVEGGCASRLGAV